MSDVRVKMQTTYIGHSHKIVLIYYKVCVVSPEHTAASYAVTLMV